MSAPTKPKSKRTRTAEHRPATRKRTFKHDDLIAVDLFSGFGGLTRGLKAAGFTTIMAANHNQYKVEVHEKNHPEAEHWIADLVDREASDYHSARDLPPGDILAAGVSCTSHSIANIRKAYEQGLTLFDMDDDPDYEARVTRSERDRATAFCVLAYAEKHHPKLILVECTTELASWGPAIPGKSKKIGDGSTYRWWLKQFRKLRYKYRIMYLNSMFFGVPQSRDRLFIAMWQEDLPTPDLDHTPPAWCEGCSEVVPAQWSWRTGVPASGSVRYGKQYDYRCPRCRRAVFPHMTPSLAALDLSNLGATIGERPLKKFVLKNGDEVWSPLAPATMARAERCRARFPEFPAVLMPAKSVHGTEKHLGQPLATQTSQQETAILSTGASGTYCTECATYDARGGQPGPWHNSHCSMHESPHVAVTGHVFAAHRHNGDGQHITAPMDTATSTHEKAVFLAVDNYQGAPRSAAEPLPTQVGTETLGLVSSGIVPFRQNTIPTTHAEPMPTQTSDQIPGLLTAAGTIKNNGSIDEADYRAHPVSDPLGTVTAAGGQSLLFSGWQPSETIATATAREWHAMLANTPLARCHFRMLGPHEVGRGCGFDVDFPGGHKGDFEVWGSARDQVDGFGNAVSPQVGEWIGLRLRAILHRTEVLA